MRSSSLLILGAAVLAAAASSARADVRQLGAVNIAADRYTDVHWRHFEGQVARLRFVATNDTIHCDHISVTYHDGTTHMVFAGTIPKDSTETVTFPEGDSRIRDVDFACKADSLDGARITLSALSAGDDAATRDNALTRNAHVVAVPGPVEH